MKKTRQDSPTGSATRFKLLDRSLAPDGGRAGAVTERNRTDSEGSEAHSINPTTRGRACGLRTHQGLANTRQQRQRRWGGHESPPLGTGPQRPHERHSTPEGPVLGRRAGRPIKRTVLSLLLAKGLPLGSEGHICTFMEARSLETCFGWQSFSGVTKRLHSTRITERPAVCWALLGRRNNAVHTDSYPRDTYMLVGRDGGGRREAITHQTEPVPPRTGHDGHRERRQF